jgi:hypothetical protein
MTRTALAVALIAGLSFTAAGPARAEEKTEQAAKPIPKGHPFEKIHEGMSDNEVRQILGEPTNREDYITGKNFIPFYHGSDRSRSNWIYKGKGNVVFTRNSYSGLLSVIEVHYDPATP